jgi:HEAT repeat protein
MSKPDPSSIPADLQTIFKAERTLDELTRKVQRTAKACDALHKAVQEARAQADEDERGLRMSSLCRILRGIKEPKAVDLLIDILGDDSEQARASAGIALEDVGIERNQDLLAGISRALKSLPAEHHALCELPFVVLSVSEGDARRALLPFLALSNAEAVASALEGLVENADPAAIDAIAPLKNDKRTVEIEDESTGETSQITLGELATDAIEALEEARRILSRSGD